MRFKKVPSQELVLNMIVGMGNALMYSRTKQILFAIKQYKEFVKEYIEDEGNSEPLKVDVLKELKDIHKILEVMTSRLDKLWNKHLEEG